MVAVDQAGIEPFVVDLRVASDPSAAAESLVVVNSQKPLCVRLIVNEVKLNYIS